MAPSEAGLTLSDFGEAFAPASEVRLVENCRTPLGSRPLEARFDQETPLSYSADIWSLAVAMWDIIGMQPIFLNGYATEDNVAAQHVDLLGPMPKTWWDTWGAKSRSFHAEGVSKEGRETPGSIEQVFESPVQRFRRRLGVGEFDNDETAAIVSLMRRMLASRPEDRPTCNEVLQSEWMVG